MKIVVFAHGIPAATRLCYPNADRADMVLCQKSDGVFWVQKTSKGEFKDLDIKEVQQLQSKHDTEVVGDISALNI